jgi:hypothetical protein
LQHLKVSWIPDSPEWIQYPGADHLPLPRMMKRAPYRIAFHHDDDELQSRALEGASRRRNGSGKQAKSGNKRIKLPRQGRPLWLPCPAATDAQAFDGALCCTDSFDAHPTLPLGNPSLLYFLGLERQSWVTTCEMELEVVDERVSDLWYHWRAKRPMASTRGTEKE